MIRLFPMMLAGALLTAAPATAQEQAFPSQQPTAPRPRAWTLAPGLDVPLATAPRAGAGSSSQGTQLAGSARLQMTVRYSPRETWFARLTGYAYLKQDGKREWNPDFTYSFGYDDWRPGTFALTYDNYGGNRWNPAAGSDQRVTRFDEGTVTASYKLPVPEALETRFGADGELHWSASVSAHVVPRYRQQDQEARGSWKRSFSVGARNRFYRRLYVEGRAFLYLDADQQQPWDPDFTYGVGWFDWRAGTLSVQYGNYSGNRWWNRSKPGTGAVRNGAVTVFFTTVW